MSPSVNMSWVFAPVEGHPLRRGTERERVKVQLYSRLTAALDRGGWSSRLGGFTPGTVTRYQLCLVQGGPHGWSGWVWRRANLFPKPWFTPRPVRAVAISYMDCAIQDPFAPLLSPNLLPKCVHTRYHRFMCLFIYLLSFTSILGWNPVLIISQPWR